jgi:hypothetical protein
MPLPKWELRAVETVVCGSCQSANTVRVFPAAFRNSDAPTPGEAALEGEAACFDHPSKRAVAACSQCGRFVCGLCSVESHAEIWCPSCVAAGAGQAKAAKAETSRVLYDSTALTLPLASLLFYPLTLIAAPASLVLSIMRWNRPLSLVRPNRWRFVAAILISLTEITLWTLGIYFLATTPFRRPR